MYLIQVWTYLLLDGKWLYCPGIMVMYRALGPDRNRYDKGMTRLSSMVVLTANV